MKEEIGKLTETVVRSGQAVISGLKSETDKLIDEAVAQMDDKKKKTWSGYDSIQLKEAPDTVVPGCLVLEGGSFRGCYTSGVLDVLMENGINLQTTIGTSAGALCGWRDWPRRKNQSGLPPRQAIHRCRQSGAQPGRSWL